MRKNNEMIPQMNDIAMTKQSTALRNVLLSISSTTTQPMRRSAAKPIARMTITVFTPLFRILRRSRAPAILNPSRGHCQTQGLNPFLCR